MKKFFDLDKSSKVKSVPLFVLCIAAVLHYMMLLLGFKYADMLFFASICSFFAFLLLKSALNNKLKIIITVCIFVICAIYFAFICEIAVPVASFAVKNPVSFACLGAVFDTLGILDFARLPLYSSVGGMRIISGEVAVGFCELAQKSASSNAGVFLAVRTLSVFSACGSILSVECDKIIKFLLCAVSLLTGNICPVLLCLLFVSPARYFFLFLILGAQAIVCSFMNFSAVYAYSPSVYEIFMLTSNKTLLAAVCALSLAASYCAARRAASRKEAIMKFLGKKILEKHRSGG